MRETVAVWSLAPGRSFRELGCMRSWRCHWKSVPSVIWGLFLGNCSADRHWRQGPLPGFCRQSALCEVVLIGAGWWVHWQGEGSGLGISVYSTEVQKVPQMSMGFEFHQYHSNLFQNTSYAVCYDKNHHNNNQISIMNKRTLREGLYIWPGESRWNCCYLVLHWSVE